MPVTVELIQQIFQPFLDRDVAKFWGQFSEEIETVIVCPVKGERNYGGTCKNKTELFAEAGGLAGCLASPGPKTTITNIFIVNNGTTAIIEAFVKGITKAGGDFQNHFCWIAEFEGETMVKSRIYEDSALVEDTLAKNKNL